MIAEPVAFPNKFVAVPFPLALFAPVMTLSTMIPVAFAVPPKVPVAFPFPFPAAVPLIELSAQMKVDDVVPKAATALALFAPAPMPLMMFGPFGNAPALQFAAMTFSGARKHSIDARAITLTVEKSFVLACGIPPRAACIETVPWF